MVFPQRKLRELALFAGAGGGILGGKLLGWECVCAVEIDSYCRNVLLARQRDGMLSRFPIWDDVRTFDGKPWRGRVDVISGGFPCQDISCAGKGKWLDGERSGLWVEMARIIREVQPKYVFVENSPVLTVRGLGRVLGDLAEIGYDARWGMLGAADVCAPHKRERIWIVVCDSNEIRRSIQQNRPVAELPSNNSWMAGCECVENDGGGWWSAEPDMGRVVDGMADWVDRIGVIGNGQVSRVAASAWQLLIDDFVAEETK